MRNVSCLMLAMSVAVAGLSVSSKALAQAPVSSVTGSGDLESRVARLERLLQARGEQTQRMSQQLGNLQSEVSELRGITERHSHQLAEILDRQRDLYQEIDRRMGDIRNGGTNGGYNNNGGTGGYNNSGSGLNGASSPAVSVPTSGSGQNAADSYSGDLGENEAYDRAIALVLEERRYDDAIPAFQNFITNYPNSNYLGNAHYWLGQLLYARNDYTEAERHFLEVVENFPESSKRADCMLKLGIMAQSEDNLDQARSHFQAVIEELIYAAVATGYQTNRKQRKSGSLAQLVEQLTFNQLVAGSNPARPTTFLNTVATPRVGR